VQTREEKALHWNLGSRVESHGPCPHCSLRVLLYSTLLYSGGEHGSGSGSAAVLCSVGGRGGAMPLGPVRGRGGTTDCSSSDGKGSDDRGFNTPHSLPQQGPGIWITVADAVSSSAVTSTSAVAVTVTRSS
jgi:hypothetical protein